MSEPVTGKPDEETDGRDRRRAILRRSGVAFAAVLVIALVGAGGYLLGNGSGEDLDAARAQGATAGFTKGKASSGDAYAQGEALGRRVTFAPAFRDAYKIAYREAFKGSEFEAPAAERISVPVP